MARLLDHFAPCVSAGLVLAEKLEKSGDHLEAASSVREALRDEIFGAKTAAQGETRAQADIDLVVFAVIAWIDEIMLRYPEWGQGVANLQGELLNTQMAREQFFSNLDGLTPGQDEVREVYYLLLSLGFQGLFGQLENGSDELERLKDLHERQLVTPPLVPGRLLDEKLTPQPYAVTPPPPPRQPAAKQARFPWGRAAMAAVALLLLVVIGGFLGLRGLADRRLQAVVAQLQCASVQADIGFNGVARLAGHVESFIDQQLLLESAAGSVFVRRVDNGLDVQNWPFCEVLIDVEPLKQLTEAEDLGSAIWLAGGGDKLVNGEFVVVEAESPNFDAFVYMYYLRGDGGVVHLLPNTILTDNRRSGGAAIAVGDASSGFRLRVSPPFGKEMLLIVAASEPLLGAGELRNSSNFEDFIGALRAGLAEVERAGGQVAASYFFLESQP